MTQALPAFASHPGYLSGRCAVRVIVCACKSMREIERDL